MTEPLRLSTPPDDGLLVELRGITKRFPGVVANDGIDFDLRAGEIHALLGENGAGKTTLMRILYGLEDPDAGEIMLSGHPITISSPVDALAQGIGMVHQHFTLVPTMTVAENVVLGLPQRRGLLLDLRQPRRRLRALAASLGFDLNPNARISTLSVGEQQRVELLKALYRDIRILILDEPTAVLTPGEVGGLFELLRDLARRGLGIVLITHKLQEALEICSRVTVLRQGLRVSSLPASVVTERTLARMMVGRELPPLQRVETTPTAPVLVVEGLSTARTGRRPGLQDLTFAVRGAEIVSIAGVDGNGQQELAEVLAGLRPPVAGRVTLDAREITALSAAARRRLGVGFVPQDRTHTALALELSVEDNAVLHVHADPPLARWGIRTRASGAVYASRLLQEYDVRAGGPDVPMRTLSGGNQQKLVLARELALAPRVLIAAQPTRGLDVAATEFMHAQLLSARREGRAVLLISTDLDEVLSLSDRILVMHGHRIVGEVAAGKVSLEELGLLMTGAHKATNAL